MSTLGRPFIDVPGLANFRDLGDTPIASDQNHRFIRTGLIYRSAEPSQLTLEGIAVLQSLNITHVWDLRSAVEIVRHAAAIREWPGSQRMFVPLFEDADYSPEAIAIRFKNYSLEGCEGFVEAYRTILEHGSQQFAKILRHLASSSSSSSSPPSPILIHCTAGKDRTGVICAIILSLCGVSDDDIAREYSLTELGLAFKREQIKENLLRNPTLRDNPQGAERMLRAKPENMLAALDMLRKQYGSAEQYVLNQCLLTRDDIAQIRKNLIVEAPSATLQQQSSTPSASL